MFCKATGYIASKVHGLTVEASLKMSWFSVGGFGLRREFEKALRGLKESWVWDSCRKATAHGKW